MTRIVLATAYIDLADDHQLYTLAFTDDCDEVCSLMLIRRQVVEGIVYLCYDYISDSNHKS